MSTEISVCKTELRQSDRLAAPYTGERWKFEEVLINFFKPYMKFSTKEPSVGIECILLSQQQFLPHLQDKCLARMYIDVIFGIIEIFRITDGDVIRNSIEEYFLHRLHSKNAIEERYLEPPSLLRKLPKSDIYYEVTLTPGKYMKKISIDSFFYSPNLLFSSDVERLLRYGIPFDLDDDDTRNLQQDFFTLALLETLHFNVQDKEVLQTRLNDHYRTYGQKRRLYFVCNYISIVFMYEKLKVWYKDANKSLRLIYLSIPDPLIKVTEIERFFEIALEGKAPQDSVKDFCRSFVKIYPMSEGHIQPRSLEHLCRCQIRKCLRESMKLPHGVWSLKLPKKLQNYILLQQNQYAFYPDYAKYLVPEKSSSDDTHTSPKRPKTSRDQ